ncbi:hypothetical protein IKE67_09410 [bacterium]|nr:hypothetical protein [bacterium]
MQMRIFLSVLITFIIAIFTKFLWFTYPIITLNFDISGQGNYIITALLNRSDNNKFIQKKTKRATKEIQLSELLPNISIEIPNVKKVKRIKLIFTNKNNHISKIIISNIQLKNEKIELNDLKQFIAKNADIEIENNKLIVTSKNCNSFQLIYDKNINLKIKPEFDIFLLFSIIILTFLLTYKLTIYLPDFKNIINKSKIEVVFLAIFFIFLFIPMSNIDTSSIKAKNENRFLGKLPHLITNKKVNYNYGKEFNEWFNDRFALRTELLQLNDTVRFIMSKGIYTATGWKMYKNCNVLCEGSFYGYTDNVNDDELLQYSVNLNKLNLYCKNHNIKLYLLIVPRLSDFFNCKYVDKIKIEPDVTEKIIESIRHNSDIKIIYPKNALLQANKITPVFYKLNPHWTKTGAYVGYYELIKIIQKDFPQVKILDKNILIPYYNKRISVYFGNKNFYEGPLSYFKIPKEQKEKLLDVTYTYYKNPYSADLIYGNLSNISIFNKNHAIDEEFYYKDGANFRVMLIANSFGRDLVEYLPYSFKHTIRLYDNYRGMKFSEYESAINEYKPNIIIISFQSSYINHLLNLYPNKYSLTEQ